MSKVSVLLSAYNGEKYIIEQLESLLKQTKAIDELLIIDDCSTDKTYILCDEFIKMHYLSEHWKLVKNERNLGWKKNFHLGQKMTHNEIIMFCDQDDIWLPNKVEIVCEMMDKRKDIDVIGTEEILYYGGARPKEKTIKNRRMEIIYIKDKKKNYFIRCPGCTMAVRREFSDKIYSYFIETWAHDDMMWKLAALEGKMGLCHFTTILHRIHGNNESVKRYNNLQSRVLSVKREIDKLQAIKRYINDNINTQEQAKLIELVEQHLKANFLRMEFLTTRKITLYVKLFLKYPYIYRTKHQLLADLGVVYKMRH